jgi:hypothetical protein
MSRGPAWCSMKNPTAPDPARAALARGEVIETFPQEPLDPKIAAMIQPRKFEGPIRIQISDLEQAHHAELRKRSYELSVARGHMRRN